jgi:DNA-binding transcriptional LysR family regulator
MLKLEALRTFTTVANAGNIADAAAMLGRTPSAVSMTLKQLEGAIGGALFETDRKNALTALGRYTLETAEAQINGFDASLAAIRAFAGNQIGRLSIAAVPSVATTVIPMILPDFIASRPRLEVELLDADSRSVASMIDGGMAELGIAGPPQQAARLAFAPLFSDRFRVVFGPGASLGAVTRPLVWRDLADQTFIRNEASDAIELPELRDQYFRATMTVRNVSSLLALVRAGMGITLLPTLATLTLPTGVVARDIEIRGAVRQVGLIQRKSQRLSPVGAAFADHIRQSLTGMEAKLDITATGE